MLYDLGFLATSGSPAAAASGCSELGNLAWGGPDVHTLFLTVSTSLYAIRTKVGPPREPYLTGRQ